MSLITKLPNVLSQPLGRTGLKLAKSSPKLLFAAGIVGVVATAVTASRATLKVEAILDEAQTDLKKIESVVVGGKSGYSADDRRADLVIVYAQMGGKLAKLYALPVGIGILSIFCLTKSHTILTSRNAGLTAAYAALDKGFREYRERVVDNLGPDVDRLMRHESERVDTTKEGDIQESWQRRAIPKPPGDYSIYARFFDELCPSYNSVPEYNHIFLKCQQDYANDLLRARGHIFLNEVYDMIGIPRSKEGSVVGWVLGNAGDNYVDFGIYDSVNQKAIDFVNGREGAILLDFNVDGLIYDKI